MDSASIDTLLNSSSWPTQFRDAELSAIGNDTITTNASAASEQPLFNQSTTTTNMYNMCLDEYVRDEFVYDFYLYSMALNFVGVIGILGNIVTMIILSRPQMRSSINYLLIGLARCDTVLIIASMLLYGLSSVYPYSGYMATYYFYIYPNIAPVVYPISAASQTASSYLTLMVSLERYVAVCHPLRARALCTYGRSRYYVAFCAIFAVLYNVCKLWEAQVIAFDSPKLGRIYCVSSTPMRRDPLYITLYIHWCYLIVNYFIPFTGLVVFNTLIFRQVRRANRERQRLSRSEKREIGLATMLLAVVVVFFVLNVPALYVNVSEAFYQHIDDELVVVSNLCVTFNSCVNFIIYVIFGEKFKRLFFALFCKCLQDSPDGLIHDDSSFSNGADGGGGGGGGGGAGGNGSSMRSGSKRFNRHGTARCSRNGVNTTVTNFNASWKGQRSIRTRAPSPAPCVYYPARELQRTHSGYDCGVVGGGGLSASSSGGAGTIVMNSAPSGTILLGNGGGADMAGSPTNGANGMSTTGF